MALSVEGHIKEMQKAHAEADGDPMSWDELSFDQKRFPNNSLTKSDWAKLFQMPNAQAYAFTSCDLETVEVPEKEFEYIEVLDLSGNNFSNLKFLEKFPSLVSLTLHNVPNVKSEELIEALKNLKELKVLEFDDEATFGFESTEELRKKCFELVPKLLAVNNQKPDGTPFEEEDEEEEEEEDWDEEEDGDWGEEEEDGGEWDEEEEEEEPATKRQKTA